MNGFSTVRSAAFFLSIQIFSQAASAHPAFDPWDGLIEQEQRSEIVLGLCNEIKRNYAGWALKKQILLSEGYSMAPVKKDAPVADGEKICTAAVAQEKSIPNPIPRSRLGIAKSNLEFRDRVQRLSAEFKDSHFSLVPTQGRTPIQLGFAMREIQGKFFVSGVAPFLNTFLSASMQSGFKVGDEILSLNGESVAQARDKLIPYVSASSERAAKKFALNALTSRYFVYPQKGSVEVKFRSASGESTAQLTWIYGASTLNSGFPMQEDDATYLESIGANLNPEAFNKSHNLKSLEGTTSEEMLEAEARRSFKGNLTDVETVYGSSGRLAMVGIYKNQMMIIQIRGFANWSMSFTTAAMPSFRGFVELKDFLAVWLKTAEKAGMPVVLDLRENPGGNPGNAVELIRLLLPQGASAQPLTMGIPITYSNRFTIMQDFSPVTRLQENGGSLAYEKGFAMAFTQRFQAEQDRKSFMSPLYRPAKIASADVLSRAPKLVVWVSEDCVSACEIATSMLMRLPTTKVIGTPLNGTGMGQWFGKGQVTSLSVSDPYHLFVSSLLPNFYFGAPSDISDEQGLLKANTASERAKLVMENRPIKPHVVYQETLVDLKKNGLGWIQATEQLLFQNSRNSLSPVFLKQGF